MSFLSSVRREGLTVHVSKAAVVGGGLSPPPSQVYPGTKCFMVTVTIENNEHHGFGPTKDIARKAAIVEAYKSLGPLILEGKLKNLSMQDETFSDESNCCEDIEHPNLVSTKNNIQVYPPKPSKKFSLPYVYGSVDVISVLFKMAEQKGVKINFQFLTTFPPTDVTAVVFGGGMVFEGRSKRQFEAQCEAAQKMLDVLKEWPSILDEVHKKENIIPRDSSKGRVVVYPYGPIPTRPVPPPSPPPPPPPISSHLQGPYSPLMSSSSPYYMKENTHPLPDNEISSSEEELEYQTQSLGLCEVVPSQSDSLSDSKITAEGQDTKMSYLQEEEIHHGLIVRPDRCDHPMSKNISTIAPFDSNIHYSDPFQFTVRLPKKKSESTPQLGRPSPWTNIHEDDEDDLPPALSGIKLSSRNTLASENLSVECKRDKRPPPVKSTLKSLCSLAQDYPPGSMSGDIASFTSTVSTGEPDRPKQHLLGAINLPTHFLLESGANSVNKSSYTERLNELVQGNDSCLQKRRVGSSLSRDVVDSILTNVDVCVGMPTEGPIPR